MCFGLMGMSPSQVRAEFLSGGLIFSAGPYQVQLATRFVNARFTPIHEDFLIHLLSGAPSIHNFSVLRTFCCCLFSFDDVTFRVWPWGVDLASASGFGGRGSGPCLCDFACRF